MPATVSHALSMTTPIDTRYENQPVNWNSAHAFTLNAVGSEVSGAFGNGGGVSFGLSADGFITAAAPAGAPSPINFSAGTTSSNIGSVVFSDASGVSWGLNGSTITASVRTNYQSAGAYLTTAALSGDTTKYAGVGETVGTIAGTDIAITMNTDGLSLAYPKYITTAALSGDTTKYAGVGETVGTIAGTDLAMTVNTDGVSIGYPKWITTADLSANSSNYAGVGETVGTIAGTDLAMTVNTAGVSIGYPKWITTAALSGDTTKYAGVGETVGTIAGTDIAITMNTDGLSLGYPKYITTARASTDAIGLNTAQSNVTWTVNSSGLSFDARGYAGTGTTFAGANISGSLTQNSVGINMSLSVAAPGAAAESNAFNLLGANTAGNTTATGSTIGLSGLNLTLSGANNSQIVLSAPATSSLVGTSGLSISTAGSTISALPIALSVWDPYPITTGTATSSHAPASAWFSKMVLNWPVVVSYANVFKSLNVSAPGMSSQNSSLTNKFSYSHGLTLFTRQDFGANSTRMSQWTTASFGMTGSLSQSSSSASVALSWVTNSTGGTTSFSTSSASNLWTNFFTGMQMFRIPLVTTLTPGEYFIGQQHSSTTATVGSNFTLLSVSNLHIAPQANTFATITSSGSLAASSPEGLGLGVASAVTTNNTMAMSVISANTQQWWYMNFSNA